MTAVNPDLIEAAADVLRRSPSGPRALEELEWSPTPLVDDAEWVQTTTALFLAQGMVLAATPALGVLVAHSLLSELPDDDLTTVGVVGVSTDGTVVDLVCPAGTDSAQRLVVAHPNGTVYTVEVDDLRPVPGPAALDPRTFVALRCDPYALVEVGESGGDPVALAGLVRFCLATEILGASRRLIDLAVAHAGSREQFGQPIGSFQALAHLLAEASVQLSGLAAGVERIGPMLARPDVTTSTAALKALAGRVGRTVSQTCLQVLGAAGFLWEHDHHRLERRILTLDAMCGGVDELTASIGMRARVHGLYRLPVF